MDGSDVAEAMADKHDRQDKKNTRKNGLLAKGELTRPGGKFYIDGQDEQDKLIQKDPR
jgi:hypothetical protein